MWASLRTGRLGPVVSPEEAERQLAGQDVVGGTKLVGTPDAVRAGLEALVADTGAAELMVTSTAYDVATRIATLRDLAG